MSFLDYLLGRTPRDQLAKEQASRKAIARAYGNSIRSKTQKGIRVTPQQTQRYREALNESTPGATLSTRDRRTARVGDAVANNFIGRNTLTGLASLSPTVLGGNAIGYTGRGISALGGNGRGMTNYGDRLAQWGQVDQNAPQKTAFQSRGFGDDLFRGGVRLAGDALAFGAPALARGGAMGLAKASPQLARLARFTPTTNYFTGAANNLAGNMERAGYSPQASFLAGTGLGATSAALERTGLDKITGRVGSQGITNAAKRIAISGLTEGGTEGAQQFADNAFSKYTYDPNRSLTDGVLRSAAAGGILGAGARVPIEIGSNPQARQQVRQGAVKVKDSTSLVPKDLLNLRKQYQVAYDKETNPTRKKQIGRALTELNTEIRRVSQGGYIAGPKAIGFADAQKAGRVFEGVDGKPRFEVSDEGAKLNTKAINDKAVAEKNANPTLRLEEALKHDELYKQYPQLKDARVTFTTDTDVNGKAWRDREGFYQIEVNTDRDIDSQLKTLLHEVQHHIQRVEGFAQGGDPLKVDARQINAIKNNIAEQYQALDRVKDPDTRRKIIGEANRLEKQLDALNRGAIDEYRNLAGEAEARAVAARINMSDGERYKANSLDLSNPEIKALAEKAKQYNSGAEMYQGMRPVESDVIRKLYPEDMPQGQKFATFHQQATGKTKPRLKVEATPELVAEAKKHDTAQSFIDKIRGSATQYGEYNPKLRLGGTGGSRLTDLGVDPNETVTIYRGLDQDVKNRKINNGDFVTADYESALSYAQGDEYVVSKQVKAKDLIAEDDAEFKEYGFDVGAEFIYSTKQSAKKPLADNELTQIWEDAKGYTVDAKPQSTFYDSLDVPKDQLIIRDGGGKAMNDTSYRGTHQINKGTSIANADVEALANQIKSKYGLTNYDQKDIAKLKKLVANPEQDVKIYRASPKNELNSGDWVTTDKTYANDIKRQNGGKVYEHTVKAKDLNLPQNIEDNPSLARFSAFQYAPSENNVMMSIEPQGKTYGKLKVKIDQKGNLVSDLDSKTAQKNTSRLLKDVNTVRKQIFNAELETLREQQPTRNLTAEIKKLGGISSSAYETLPASVKNKNGVSADVMARDLGFESEDELVKAIQDQKKPKLVRELAEEALANLENGNSQYSSDWKQTEAQALEAIDKAEELPTIRKNVKILENTPPPPRSKEEWDAILGDTRNIRVESSDNGLNIVKETKGTATGKTKDIQITQTGEPDIKTNISGDFKTSTNQYLGAILSSSTQARKFMDSLPKLSKNKAEQAIIALDSGQTTGDPEIDAFNQQFKGLTDRLFARYTNDGIDMGYVENYLPRIYKNPETGEAISKQEYDFLQRSTGRTKGRVAPVVNPDDLLYKTPEALLGHYVKTMERVNAGRKYFDNLKRQGYIVEAGSKPQGMVVVDAEGIAQPGAFQLEDGSSIQGNFYAYPEVAEDLRRVFGSQREYGALRKAARLSSIAQDIGLSGGLPGTPMNAFTFAQLTKELSAGRVVGPVKALRNSFSKKKATQYFTENADLVSEMQKQGISISTDYNTDTVRALSNDISLEDGRMATLWNKAMSDPTFKRFMPILQVEMYKNIRAHKGPEVASQVVKNFYGLTDLATARTRSKNVNNALTVGLFAPKFRESMIRFWINNGKALKNPTSPEYRENLKFMAGAAITFGAMQAINMALNGVPTWENPDGKEDKLIIPGSPLTGGKDIGVPFLSSIATVPRNIFMAGANSVRGDFDEAGKNIKSFASFGLRPAMDIYSNEDYFGGRIYDPEASTGERLGQSGSYAFQQYMHPYIREGLNVAKDKLPEDAQKFVGAREQSGFETASRALEMPLRFYNPDYYKGQSDKFGSDRNVGSKTKEKGDSIPITSKTVKENGKYVSRDKYDAILDATEKEDGLPPVNKYDNQELKKAFDDVKKEAKRSLEDMGIPTDGINFTSMTAREYVQYKQKLDGANQIEKDKLKKSFARSMLNSQLADIERDLYSLSEENLKRYYESGVLSDKNIDNALAVEKQLYDAGLITKETLARKLDLVARGYKTSKKSGGRSRNPFNIPSGFSLLPGGGSSSDSVARLLADARVELR